MGDMVIGVDPAVPGSERSSVTVMEDGKVMLTMDYETLGDALPKEMARVRDVVLPLYLEIGRPGEFAAELMRQWLKSAEKALSEGDVGRMIACYTTLKGFKE